MRKLFVALLLISSFSAFSMDQTDTSVSVPRMRTSRLRVLRHLISEKYQAWRKRREEETLYKKYRTQIETDIKKASGI